MSWLRGLLGGGSGGNGSTPERIPPPPPDPDRFWSLINSVADVSFDDRAEALQTELKSLDPDGLIAFDADYRRALAQAYRWDLWAAAYVINGGCSDDGFDYFCDWLISKGRDAFETAVADPSSLITVVREIGDDEDADFEEFRYAVQDVYEEKTGDMMPLLDMGARGEPAGEPWDEDDVEAMFPQLAEWADARD